MPTGSRSTALHISFILSCKLARPHNRLGIRDLSAQRSAVQRSTCYLFLVTVPQCHGATVPRWHSIANQVYGTQRTGARSSTLPWLGFSTCTVTLAPPSRLHQGPMYSGPGVSLHGCVRTRESSSSQAHGCGCVLRADRECST